VLLPQVAALTACCSFINSLEDNREREVFQPLLVPMLAALVRAVGGSDSGSSTAEHSWLVDKRLGAPMRMKQLCAAVCPVSQALSCCLLCRLVPPQGRCLTAGDENAAQDVLELLIEVAEGYPRFLRRHLQELVGAMMQVRLTGRGVQHQRNSSSRSGSVMAAAPTGSCCLQIPHFCVLKQH
jgi:hypothetical protein